MTVIKRSQKDTTSDLITAIDLLIPLLRDQKEDDAVGVLASAAKALRSAKPQSAELRKAVAEVVDAFEGDHELISYTFQRGNGTQWTEVEELSQASARVLSLARRMQ
jgi:ABC-type transporter Mla subunit MlaD